MIKDTMVMRTLAHSLSLRASMVVQSGRGAISLQKLSMRDSRQWWLVQSGTQVSTWHQKLQMRLGDDRPYLTETKHQ